MHGIPLLRGLLIGDDPTAWEAVGFALDGDRFTVGGVTVRLAGAQGDRGILGWNLEHPSPEDVEGIAHVDVGPPAGITDHPNGATAVDHVVAGTSDLDRTTTALGRLGIVPRRTVRGLRGGKDTVFRFFLLGTALLEVIAPPVPTSDRGARFWGLAFAVADLEAAAARLGDACGPPHDAVQPGRRIATLRHDRLGLSVSTAFMTERS